MDLLGVAHTHLLGLWGVLASVVNLNTTSDLIHWHFIQITVANLIVIVTMLVLFVLAILLPFPRHRSKGEADDE
jgi:hypothetical protein